MTNFRNVIAREAKGEAKQSRFRYSVPVSYFELIRDSFTACGSSQ
jgi:hypothetical protein